MSLPGVDSSGSSVLGCYPREVQGKHDSQAQGPEGSHSQGPTQNLQELRMFRHRKGQGSQNQDFQKHLASAKEWKTRSSTERNHFHWSRQCRSKDSCRDVRPGRDLGGLSDGVLWILSPPHPLLSSPVLLPQSIKNLILHS